MGEIDKKTRLLEPLVFTKMGSPARRYTLNVLSALSSLGGGPIFETFFFFFALPETSQEMPERRGKPGGLFQREALAMGIQQIDLPKTQNVVAKRETVLYTAPAG